MKLPPRHNTAARVLYWLARFFMPDPARDCRAPTDVERKAAYALRRRIPLSLQEGNEHFRALGEFEAGEIIREHNRKLNFDRHAADRARAPVYPLHKLPG